MGELVDTLADRIGKGAIRLGTRVQKIERANGGFRVALADGEIEADRVIVALPARAASSILASCDAPLSRELSSIEYVSTATVCFAYERKQIGHPLDAAGFLVPKSEGRKITAGTFISSKWPGRAPEGYALVRAFVGGARDEATASLPEEDLTQLVRAELETLLGISGAPLFSQVFRYIGASPQPLVGHTDRVAHIQARLQQVLGLHVIGNAYDGVGIPDCIRLAERAAAEVV
jgi:oxygen-dependent protoporphyrinogen oxidase